MGMANGMGCQAERGVVGTGLPFPLETSTSPAKSLSMCEQLFFAEIGLWLKWPLRDCDFLITAGGLPFALSVRCISEISTRPRRSPR
jgi:hypothetical protein